MAPPAVEEAAAVVSDAGRAVGQAAGDAIAAELGAVLVAAADAALVAARVDRGRGALREAQADAQEVRSALMDPLARAEGWLAAEVETRALDALALGWAAGAAEMNSTLPQTVTIATGDPAAVRAALAEWPIVGHTAGEAAQHVAATWRFGAEAVLGAAAAAGSAAGVFAGLADVGRTAGNRTAVVVAEAYQAGAGAARLAVGEALRRAV